MSISLGLRIKIVKGVMVKGEEALCLALSVRSDRRHLIDEDYLVR